MYFFIYLKDNSKQSSPRSINEGLIEHKTIAMRVQGLLQQSYYIILFPFLGVLTQNQIDTEFQCKPETLSVEYQSLHWNLKIQALYLNSTVEKHLALKNKSQEKGKYREYCTP